MIEVDTEGKFEFRIKPRIEHGLAYINRAIEEIQRIIVFNKDSSEKFLEEHAALQKKVTDMEAEIESLKQSIGDKNE